MTAKRLDLQGIRGLAILAVLGFHFFPKVLPNGYLGVDQFFVLSGFLMCMLLNKSESDENSKYSIIWNFYIRRFRRILPLYYLVILLSLIFLFKCFPDTAIETNEISAEKALFFISNRLKTDSENYFEMLSIGTDIFTHTWSLSVEIQFYILAPFIFLLPFRLTTFIVLSIVSFLYFHFLPMDFAFLNVFARIWQFLCGMLAFLISDRRKSSYSLLITQINDENAEDEEDEFKENYESSLQAKLLTLIVTLLILNPSKISLIVLRPIVTFITGTILVISTGEDTFLSNKFLTYFGDISYCLYLIHWPIYSFWKLTHEENSDYLFIYLFSSIIISILIYNIFEKWYIKSSNTVIIILVTLLLCFNISILKRHSFQQQVTMDNVTKYMTIDDAKRLNYEWTIHDNQNLIQDTCEYESTKPLGWCSEKIKKLNEKNFKIMIIGNSWAANHGKLIFQECGSKANSMLVGSTYGCEPLYPSKNLKRCYQNITEFVKLASEFKPDYVFHITRHVSIGDPSNETIENDPIYQFMLNQTKILTKHISKKLFILDAIPRVNGNEVSKIVDHIKNNETFADIDKQLTDETDYLMARKRNAQLMKDCGPKCQLFDYFSLFYKNDTKTFRFYDDRGFSYLTAVNHLSPHGLEYVRSVYRNICKTF
ncbi:unnamed protein product [Caenorhabditis angaria]|uniref:Acyl_transf_3 domain-containing protein n=1 Tax=Caenorhabditis angaria TaxID=860376 RepID=A0A9P1J490_9PELO|nr:unnamed protein product [Caenorhabditis angaria]